MRAQRCKKSKSVAGEMSPFPREALDYVAWLAGVLHRRHTSQLWLPREGVICTRVPRIPPGVGGLLNMKGHSFTPWGTPFFSSIFFLAVFANVLTFRFVGLF